MTAGRTLYAIPWLPVSQVDSEGDLRRHSGDLAHGAATEVRHPEAGAVEKDVLRVGADGIGAHVGAAPPPQPDNSIFAIVPDPDVFAVKGHASRTVPEWEGALHFPVAGTDRGDRAIVLVVDPYFRAIESEINRLSAYGYGVEHSAIARAQFGHLIYPKVCGPDIASVEENCKWAGAGGADGKCAEDGAIAAEEFCHRAGRNICDPDVGAVPSDAPRRGDRERAEERAIAGSQFADRRTAEIAYPNVGTVKGDKLRLLSYGEGALKDAVAGAQLGHCAVIEVCAPNIRAVKGEIHRAIPDWKALDEIGFVEFLRVCRQDGKLTEGHEAHRRRDGDKKQKPRPLRPLFEYSFH